MVITTDDKRTIVEFPVEAETDESFFTELKFVILAERVKEETKLYSFISQKNQSPTYRKLLEMGGLIVPFVLKYLDLQPALWFHALRTLTGENPVPAEHAGNIELMKKDWLQWGKKRKLI